MMEKTSRLDMSLDQLIKKNPKKTRKSPPKKQQRVKVVGRKNTRVPPRRNSFNKVRNNGNNRNNNRNNNNRGNNNNMRNRNNRFNDNNNNNRGGAMRRVRNNRVRGAGAPYNRNNMGNGRASDRASDRANYQKDDDTDMRAMIKNGGADKQPLSTGTKIRVSNLDLEVLSDDIKELFQNIGPVKNAQVYFDRNGVSKGIAEVVFRHKADALKSISEFDARELDGKPMKITLLEKQSLTTNRPKKSFESVNKYQNRDVVQNKVNYGVGDEVSYGGGFSSEVGTKFNRPFSKFPRGGGRSRGRGGGRSWGRGRGRSYGRTTNVSLDDDLDNYMNSAA